MQKHQSLIGSLQWAVSLGRLDVTTAVMTMRQHVIVMRGRFATQESLVLDPDIMVEVHVNTKRVS